MVDGIHLPRSYVFSANVFGRDCLDIGLLQRIEVVRGATSALYGSDGMAGLVNFITAEPSAFLDGDKRTGGRVSLGSDDDDHGKRVGATVAGQAGDTVQWLLGGNATRARELGNMSTNDAAKDDHTWDEVRRKVSAVGRVAGREREAQALQTDLDAQWATVQKVVAAATRRPHASFILPHGASAMVACTGTAADALIRLRVPPMP